MVSGSLSLQFLSLAMWWSLSSTPRGPIFCLTPLPRTVKEMFLSLLGRGQNFTPYNLPLWLETMAVRLLGLRSVHHHLLCPLSLAACKMGVVARGGGDDPHYASPYIHVMITPLQQCACGLSSYKTLSCLRRDNMCLWQVYRAWGLNNRRASHYDLYKQRLLYRGQLRSCVLTTWHVGSQ